MKEWICYKFFFIFSGAKIKLHDHQNFLNDAFKNVSVVVSCGESFEVRRYVFNSTQSGKGIFSYLKNISGFSAIFLALDKSVVFTKNHSNIFLAKISWKQRLYYLKNLLSSWFDEIFFFSGREFIFFSTLCVTE